MLSALLTKIHDPNVSLGDVINSLAVVLGEDIVRSIIAAGLIHTQQLSDIISNDVISQIINGSTQTEIINYVNLNSRKVFDNKDLCCRIVSHCNWKDINQCITFINRYFNSVCNSEQTYQQHQYSEEVVRGEFSHYMYDPKKRLDRESSWNKRSKNIISRYQHCNHVTINHSKYNTKDFYSLDNVVAFENFTRMRKLGLNISKCAIGDGILTVLNMLWSKRARGMTVSDQLESLTIHNNTEQYVSTICKILEKRTFSSLKVIRLIKISKDNCIQVFKSINNTRNFPKLNHISISVADQFNDSWRLGKKNTVVNCRQLTGYSENDAIIKGKCENSMLFWNSWHEIIVNETSNHNNVWSQISTLELGFTYCQHCLMGLFVKIAAIASKFRNIEVINFENNLKLPQWFVLHFIYWIIQSQLKYHKHVKLNNIQCCEIDKSNVITNVRSIDSSVIEYNKILPTILAPNLRKMTISCSESSVLPTVLFTSQGTSIIKELDIRIHSASNYYENNLVANIFEKINYQNLEKISIRCKTEPEPGMHLFSSIKKQLKKSTNLQLMQKIATIKIDIKVDDIECFYEGNVPGHASDMLNFDEKLMPFFDSILGLINECNNMVEYQGNINVSGPEIADRDCLICKEDLERIGGMLRIMIYHCIGTKYPDLTKHYYFSFHDTYDNDADDILNMQFNPK